jgi:hypothetical protein
MTGKYAASTTVPVEQSRMEIEKVLSRWGATSFAYGWDQRGSMIEFVAHNRRVRFVLPLPDRDDPEFTQYKRGEYGAVYDRSSDAARKLWEQACRQHWRALVLVVKAKLEAVEVGISEFEQEFLANIVTADGRTIGQVLVPQLDSVVLQGPMELMPGRS